MQSENPAKEKTQKGTAQMPNQLVEENIGLVYWVLKRFYGRGYDMEELFQVGTVGLIKASRRYEADRNVAFSTYAVPLIIGEIRRFLRDDGMIHISRQIRENAGKIVRIREQMAKTENREPTVEELGERLGIDRDAVLLAIGCMGSVASIHEPVSGETADRMEGDLTMEDQLTDHCDRQGALIDRLAVRQMIEELDEKSRELISLRYFKGLTQYQTAKQMGMNQVAVSRMEKKILLHFRGEF
jgi:RNA polymerase sporulation-specific sigma factor